MKLLKRLKRKKGFTLTECLISMLIFALMASIVMQILAIAIAQYRSNDSIDKDMDTQISDLVQENALVERETTNLVMKFVSGTGGTNNITINDMKIENGSSDGADGRLQINKIDATINNNGGNKDKDKNNGGLPMISTYTEPRMLTVYTPKKRVRFLQEILIRYSLISKYLPKKVY